MASTVDQRTTGYPVTSGRTSLAAERAGIFVSLASNLQSCCQPNEGADAPPSAGHRHVGYKKHIEERLDLLRRLDWLETVAMLSGSAAVDPGAPGDAAAFELYQDVAGRSPLDLAYACVAYTGTNSTFNSEVLRVLLRYVTGQGNLPRGCDSGGCGITCVSTLALTHAPELSLVGCTRIPFFRTLCHCWRHSR